MNSPQTIRRAMVADAEAIAEIYAPFVLGTAISFEDDPPSAAEMAVRIKTISTTHPFFVAEVDGAVLAYAYASPHKPRPAYRTSADVAIYSVEGARRRGIGRALYEAVLNALAHSGHHRAYAGITLPNPASVGFHKTMGFRLIGVYDEVGFKFGSWHDVAWWGRPVGPAADDGKGRNDA